MPRNIEGSRESRRSGIGIEAAKFDKLEWGIGEEVTAKTANKKNRRGNRTRERAKPHTEIVRRNKNGSDHITAYGNHPKMSKVKAEQAPLDHRNRGGK